MKPAIRAPIPPRTVENNGRCRPKVHRPRTADLFDEYLDEVEDIANGHMGDNESDDEAQAHSNLVNGVNND